MRGSGHGLACKEMRRGQLRGGAHIVIWEIICEHVHDECLVRQTAMAKRRRGGCRRKMGVGGFSWNALAEREQVRAVQAVTHTSERE
jgi:hypothetical protein